MSASLSRIGEWSRRDWCAAAESTWLTLVATAALALFRLDRALAISRSALPRAARSVPADCDRTVDLAERVLTRLSRRCLTRAVVLHALLARRGWPSTVCLGAAVEGRFRAHAWVEWGGVRQGTIVGRQGPSDCALLCRLPARPAGARS